MPEIHSTVFSPSAAHRVLQCPPSLMLDKKFPDKGSEFAAEGTYAHAMAEFILRRYLDGADDPECLDDFTKTDFYSEAMVDYVHTYTDTCMEKIVAARRADPEAVFLPEQRLVFNEIVPGGFGMVWLGTWPKDNSPKSVARADKFLESTLDRMEATGWKGISQVQIHIRTDLSLPDPFCPSSDCIRRAIGRLHANGITVQAFTWTEGANKDALHRIWKLGFDNFATDDPLVLFELLPELCNRDASNNGEKRR